MLEATEAEINSWLFDSDLLFWVMVAREYALQSLSEAQKESAESMEKLRAKLTDSGND